MIAKSCLSVLDWMNAAETEPVTTFQHRGRRAGVDAAARSHRRGAAPTPTSASRRAGRTFVRYDASTGFAPLLGAPRVNVTNTRTGLLRSVFVPPNGVARLGL